MKVREEWRFSLSNEEETDDDHCPQTQQVRQSSSSSQRSSWWPSSRSSWQSWIMICVVLCCLCKHNSSSQERDLKVPHWEAAALQSINCIIIFRQMMWTFLHLKQIVSNLRTKNLFSFLRTWWLQSLQIWLRQLQFSLVLHSTPTKILWRWLVYVDSKWVM